MKKRKWIWVDWALILALAAVVFFGARWLHLRSRAAAAEERILYTLALSEVSDSIGSMAGGWELLIPVGTLVTSENGTAELGRVTALEVTPHKVLALQEGEPVFSAVPEKVDLLISVEGIGRYRTGDGLRISDIRIAAGGRGDFRIGAYRAAGARIIFAKRRGGA